MSQLLRLKMVGIAVLLGLGAHAQTAGGVGASSPTVRVLRSVAGTSGSEQAGRYVIEDPKTVFHIPGDKQVIVYFEWEGPLGPHHFEGYWKNPEGKVVVVSEFKYEAKQKRFGGYWSLTLTESMVSGMWSLEARVDGEVTGAHTFQVVAAPGVGPTETVRKLLEPAEVYRKGVAATVSVEKLDAGRKTLSTSSGFFVSPDRLLTAFQAIDGAAFVRVRYPDGRRAEVSLVSAWNRWQDWAVLKMDAGSTPMLPLAASKSWAVGDRVYYLDVKTEDNRTIVDANITGASKTAESGERLNLSFYYREASIGSPVVNEYGDVIAMLGGLPFPGAWWKDATRDLRTYNYGSGGTAVPIELVTANQFTSQPATLEAMLTGGQFLPLFPDHRDISRAGIYRYLDNRVAGQPYGLEDKFEYSRKDREAFVYVMWQPSIKRKGQIYFRVFGLDNKMLSQSKPGKITLNPGEVSYSTWQLNISTWPLGIYRLDVMLDQDTMWRGFLRIVE